MPLDRLPRSLSNNPVVRPPEIVVVPRVG